MAAILPSIGCQSMPIFNQAENWEALADSDWEESVNLPFTCGTGFINSNHTGRFIRTGHTVIIPARSCGPDTCASHSHFSSY